MIAGLLSVLLTVWLPYEAVFDERRLMMWDRVDAVAGAVVRRQLDWPWYMLEAVVFVGVLWLLNADKSGFPFWVGRVFRYGIVVWCVFVVAGSLLGWLWSVSGSACGRRGGIGIATASSRRSWWRAFALR